MSLSSSSRGRRWRPVVVGLAVAALSLISAPALGDNIYNSVDATIDSTAEVMPLNVGGANGSTVLAVDPTNGDGKQGCNLTGSTTLAVDVVSSDPSVATVSPSTVTFTSCGFQGTLTVTPHNQGTATISLTQTSNDTNGTFDLTPATFTVNVSAPAPSNTAPTIAVTGVDAGGSYNKGAVPAATCEVTDTEDGNSSFAATLTSVSGPYASDGIGSQTANCEYTDAGGLYASASKTYSIVDSSAPVITPHISGTLGNNGWYVSDVTLTWTVTDSESPNSLQTSGCVNQSITSDQASTDYSCSASSAGGSSGPVTVSIKRDATAPTISHALSASPNANNWFNADVTVTFTCDDATSGIASCLADGEAGDSKTLGEGANQSASGTATDLAGNTATDSATGINIDKTAPSISDDGFSSGTAGLAGWYTSAVAESFAASDALSGLADCATSFTKSSGTAEGNAVTIASGTCSDNAGNTASSIDSAAYKIDLSDPTNVAFIGGPADGGTYYYGFVPAAPTCTADDIVSGFNHCTVGGYGTGVGGHTLTATAYDNAGRSASATRTYTVSAWTLKGFYQPVDMNGVLNTVKGGSTVPLKFEIFAGSTELTDTADIASFTTQKVTCGTSTGVEDAIEVVTTGGTSLRYDTTGGQFIQNWKTPTGAGQCYKATMTALDGSSISALFKIK
jgi:hypothetical protein